jgi:hypothetical protein
MARPWRPFRALPIRLFGTLKTNPNPEILRKPYGRKIVRRGNCLDPVRGCPWGGNGGCYNMCYAAEVLKRYHILFNIPVRQILREDLLRKDLAECPESWVRIGVFGEPSVDWDLTAKVAQICHEERKDVVILTRLVNLPNERQLVELAEARVLLSFTVWSVDGSDIWKKLIHVAKWYKVLGGRAVARLVTFAFRDPLDQKRQEYIMQELLSGGLPIVEQPARLRRTNSLWRLCNPAAYSGGSYTSPSVSHWLEAGRQLDGGALLCTGRCPDCPHKCGLYS